MKSDRKIKTEKAPPKVTPAKGIRRATPKTNGKHPLTSYEHIPIGIVECALDGKYMDVNEEFCRITGYTRSALLRRGIKDLTHEDDYALDIKLHEELVAGQIPFYRLEKRYVRKDGSDIWVELTRSLVRNTKGKPLYTIGVVLDISERKQVERVLRDSVERLRLATEAAQMFTWEWDFQNNSYSLSDSFTQVLGFQTDLLPKNPFETVSRFIPAEDLQSLSNAYQKVVENQRDLHSLPCRMIDPKDGQVVWLEISAKIVYDLHGNPERMFGVAQNITESKNIQSEIAVISRMPEENPDPVMRIHRDGKILYANPASAALLEDWMQELRPVIPEELQKTIKQTFTSGRKVETEFGYSGKHFSFTVVPLLDAGYVNLYGKDITERKRAEKALREKDEQLRHITEVTPVLFSQCSRDLRYLFVNRTAAEFLGSTPEEIQGKPIRQIMGDEAFETIQPYIDRVLKGERVEYEMEIPYRAAGRRFMHVVYVPEENERGIVVGWIATVTDITERKRMEQAVAEAARQQESLYRLADQLHHTNSIEDVFNASLDAILGALSCNRASILLCDDQNIMRFVAWRGLSDAYRQATEGHSPWKPDTIDPKPIHMDDVRTAELDESLRETIQGEGIGALAFIPLVVNEKLIGKFMIYYNAPHAFGEAELDLCMTIANQLAFGIDRKRAGQALERERKLLERLFENMPVIVSMFDPTTNSMRVNAEFERRIGWKAEEVTVVSLLEALYPDPEYRQSVLQRMAAAAGTNEWVEVQVRTREGRVLDSMWANISIMEGDKLITGIALGVDITERKQTEQALRESEERFRTMANTMPSIVWTAAPDGTITYANDQWFRYVGITPEANATGWPELVLHPDDYERCVRAWTHALETVPDEYLIEVRNRRYDGQYRWFQTRAVPVRDDSGKAKAWYGVTTDIHERIEAEQRMALLAAISDMLRNVDDPSDLMYRISEAVGEHLHVKRALFNEIDLEKDREIVHRDYHQDVDSVAGVHKVTDYSSITSAEMAAGRTVINTDSKTDPRTAQDYERTYAVSGERAYVAVPLMRENRWVASFWVSEDLPRQWSAEEVSLLETVAERTWAIIEKLRINAALRESEQRFREIFEAAGVSVWVEDFSEVKQALEELRARGVRDFRAYLHENLDFVRRAVDMVRILDVNNETLELFGARSKEVLLQSLGKIFVPETEPPFVEELIALAEGQEMLREEAVLRTLDGRMISVLFTIHFGPPKGDQSRVVVTLTDITERKQIEEALRRNEQMFSTMVNSAPFGVYFIDSEFRLRAINKGSEGVFSGIDPLIGRDFAEILRIIWKEPFAREAIERFRHTLRSGESYISPTIIEPRANINEIQAYDWQIHRITMADGTFGVVCYFYDLSEQKQMEASVRASETLYRTIARSIPGGGVYVVDKDFCYLVAEGPVTEAFGLSREMLEGHTVSEAFPGERGEMMEARLQRTFAGEMVEFETELKGRVYWTQLAPVQDSIGQAIILTLDITERKRAEEALRQSEERFAQFMEHLPGLAWIKDIQGRYVYANAAAEKAFSSPREKLYGRTDEEIFPFERAAQFKENDQRALTEGQGVQMIETLMQADGVLHSSLVNKFPIPGPDGNTMLIGGTAFDITERLQAEEALRESEERFSAILRQATAGIVRKDAQGRLAFVNQAFCNMLGYTEEELVGKTVWDFMYPDDVAENQQSFHRLMAEGLPFKLERRLLRSDGAIIWVDASVSPIMDSTGRPQSAVTVEVDITGRRQAEEALRELNLQLEDRVLSRTARLRAVNQTLREEITERKRIEQALRQSEYAARTNEEKLRTLFDLLPVGISFLSPEGQIIQMNSALPNILKLSKEELLSQKYKSRKYIRADGRPMSPAEFASARALAEGRTIHNMETGILLENGGVIWTNVSAAPVDVADVGVVVVTVDITDSKRAERALQESHQRLRILSQRLVEVQEDERRALARELHDRVGQTLAALNINLIIINSQLAGEAAEQIGTRLNDSIKLVAETIALVRDVMTDLRPAVLDDYGLEAALESHLSQYISRYSISAKLEKPDQPLPRLGPSVEMTMLRIAQEALMNIARHARATEVNLSLRRGVNTVILTIQDNGIGIESWQEANRPGSHGLTIMRERAEAFDGNLRVKSVPGQGTVVEVTIPIKKDSQNQSEEEKEI